MRMAIFAAGALATVLVVAEDVTAQRLAPQILGWERHFVVTSEVVERGGRPYLAGHVGNQSGAPAWRIRLLIDGLDASGHVVSQRVESLTGDIGTFSRRYFGVPAPEPASSYRVRLFAFETMRPDPPSPTAPGPSPSLRHPTWSQ